MTEETITMYGTPACPMVPPVKSYLDSANIAYDYVNISEDTEARQKVELINNGFQSVPTLVFTDGSTLTEPSLLVLKGKLQELGYDVPEISWKQAIMINPVFTTVGAAFAIWGVADKNWLIFAIGLAMFGLNLARNKYLG